MARLEAVLFLAREPLISRKIAQLANLADGTEARTLIRRLNRLYDAAGQAFKVKEIAGGYQLLTRPEFGPWLRRLHETPAETRLSAPAMETLAVVAYRQPILRAEVSAVRGVQCDDILRQLMERNLVRIMGRSEDLGRPRLYGTTKRFLELFGLRSLDELPRAAEFRSSPQPAAKSDSVDDRSSENKNERNPDVGRAEDISSSEPNSEEKSVTTCIRPAPNREDLVEESFAALAEIAKLESARRNPMAKPISGAKADDEEDEDEDEIDDDDEDEDDDWDDDDDEDDADDEDEEDDDLVDEEWEEVDDDDEEDDDEDDEDDEEWDDEDEEDDDWDDDDDDEDEEEEEEWEDDEK